MLGQNPPRATGKQPPESSAFLKASKTSPGGQTDWRSSAAATSKRLLSPGRSRSASGTESSSQGSPSPLNMPLDSFQSANAAYSFGQEPLPYVLEGGSSPIQSPIHSRSSSMTSVKSLIRDRSLERTDHDRSPAVMLGERSLDRQMDRYQLMTRDSASAARDRRTSGYSRDRALDREYPHMGARSLERDYSHYAYSRGRSTDNSPCQYSQSPQEQAVKDSLILDLQAQVADLNAECMKLTHDLEVANEKVNSSMNSIKTFWSPELKKERALRKEESSKNSQLNEQFKVAQAEIQKQNATMKDLKKQLYQVGPSSSQPSLQEVESMKQDRDKQAKEVVILRKTVEEMEIRIETQKQTLSARDESIKKLLEMLQSKGLAVKQLEDDRLELERLQIQATKDRRMIKQLEGLLDKREKEISNLKEESGMLSGSLQYAQLQLKDQPTSTHTMQAMLEAKDSRISALEKEVRVLEDELFMLREEGFVTDRECKDSSKMDSLKSKHKVLLSEVDQLKEKLGHKETELCGLQMKVETLEKQHSEQQHYISVLKEQINAKEQHTTMFQVDLEELRDRLKDKDSTIERKSKQAQSVQVEKRKFEAEIADLKDHIDIKERKITVLQRKIENLEDLIEEKDDLLNQTNLRLESAYTDSTDSALSSMEESLTEKDRQIERLKEQREQGEQEHIEECERYRTQSLEMKTKMDKMQLEFTDKQTEVCELREETAEFRSQKLQLDSKIRQMQLEEIEKMQEIENLKYDLTKLQEEKNLAQSLMEEATLKESKTEELQAEKYKEEVAKAQSEVDRLLEIMKETENEKHEKDIQIKELQDLVKEYKQKMGTLKRNQQTEKKKNAHMLEEARKREDEINVDASQLKTVMKQKEDRVEELEEALRESVRITAEREMAMAEQAIRIQELEKMVTELTAEIEKMQSSYNEQTAKLGSLTRQLEEKDAKLRRYHSDRHRQLEEVYEMKQEAIQAAITEKDANIALLEMTSTKKQKNIEEIARLNKEKEKLQQQLKELTETRMRLMQKKKEQSTVTQKSLLHRMKGATDEQVIRAVRKIEHSKKRLRTLIDQLLAACLDTDPQLLEGLPRIQQGPGVSVATLRTLTHEELRVELHRGEWDCSRLQDYANVLLQRIGSTRPELLDNFVLMMESSDTESCQST